MNEAPNIPDAVAKIPWLAHIGLPVGDAAVIGSLHDILAMIASDPDHFFASPYATGYEDLCVQDYEAASVYLAKSPDRRPNMVAERAYFATQKQLRNPEVSALVSDDALTITALILSGSLLPSFTLDRLAWYQKGRVPWGYEGKYPDGQWLIL